MQRADVIETTIVKKHVLDVPTQAMKPWLRQPAKKSTDVQQADKPKKAAVRTYCDMACQTDFDPPVDFQQQTSADIAVQTIEVNEVAAQTTVASIDTTTQADIVDEKKEEDHFFLATLLQIVGAMMRAEHEDIDWSELGQKFNYVADKMAERGYPIQLAPRRSTRQHDAYGYRHNPARGSAVRGGARGGN